MLSVLSNADAVFLAALVAAAASITTAGISAGIVGRRVRRVEAEVTPNGGSSLKDQVGRLEQRSAALEQAFTGHDARLCRVESSANRTESGVRMLLDAAGIHPHPKNDEIDLR